MSLQIVTTNQNKTEEVFNLILFSSLILTKAKLYKKVLLRERMRHTARRLASTCYVVPLGGTPPPPSRSQVRTGGGRGYPLPDPGEGYPLPRSRLGGHPFPGPDGGTSFPGPGGVGVSNPADGGTPVMGVPPVQTWEGGTPPPTWTWEGYLPPQSRPGKGVPPHPISGWGTPPPPV